MRLPEEVMMLPELDTNTEQPQPLTSEHIVRIGAQTLLVLIVFAGIVVMCCGCSGSFRYRPKDSTAKSYGELVKSLAAAEARLAVHERSLEEAKQSRDTRVRLAESADGYWEKSNASKQLSHADTMVRFAMIDIEWVSEEIAEIKAQLTAIEDERAAATDAYLRGQTDALKPENVQ